MNSIPSVNSPCKIRFTQNFPLILENPSDSNGERHQSFASGEPVALACAPVPEGSGWFSLFFLDAPKGREWVARGVNGSVFERV